MNTEINENELDFELRLSDILQKSNSRAWFITFISILLLCAVILLYIFKPLTKTEPFIIQVEKSTGFTQVLSILNEKNIEYTEAIDKFFISQYVKKREQYYYALLSNDYEYTQLNSIKTVSDSYRKIYTGEKARDKVLGAGTKEIVKIISVSLGISAGLKNSTIRIKIDRKEKGIITSSKVKVVTLSYDYFPAIRATEKERLLNPLGFKVTEYRVDVEIGDD